MKFKISPGKVSEGLKKSIHADKHHKKPDYHKPGRGLSKSTKKI